MRNSARHPLGVLLLAALFAAGFSGTTDAGSARDPKAVAQKLYSAWHWNSRKSASAVADPDAIEKLFGVRWRKMKFEGCQRRDEGGFECIYRDVKLDLSLAMIVEGGASLGGYNVASLSFSSEQ